jgi:hypothetical protein
MFLFVQMGGKEEKGGKLAKFIHLRRRPRALPGDECVQRSCIIHVLEA